MILACEKCGEPIIAINKIMYEHEQKARQA